jgi:hypothetical protein
MHAQSELYFIVVLVSTFPLGHRSWPITIYLLNQFYTTIYSITMYDAFDSISRDTYQGTADNCHPFCLLKTLLIDIPNSEDT